jgi:uncharacterized protein (DUF1778 family)
MSAARSSDRWAFRVESNADQLVRQAAELCHRSLTDFVVQAAVVEAERVVSDRTRFLLDSEAWDRFNDLLDRPVQQKAALKRLLDEPSVFE